MRFSRKGGANVDRHLLSIRDKLRTFPGLHSEDVANTLKVEKANVLYPKDFSKFFDQTAAYAIGLVKRIGVLSVLESSPKSAPVGVVEDDTEVFFHQAGKSSIVIVVVVVRGGFPKPSSYSR